MNYDDYTISLHYDKRLYKYDLLGSKVHVQMLAKQGIISASDSDTIQENLQVIEQEIESGKIEWKYELEDIHMNIESRLTELTGDIGAKLHTGRSRNDQPYWSAEHRRDPPTTTSSSAYPKGGLSFFFC